MHEGITEVADTAIGDGGCGKTALVSGSLEKMLKLRSRILLILSFKGW